MYYVQKIIVKEGDVTLCEDPPTKWVTRDEFLASGVSTGMKKVHVLQDLKFNKLKYQYCVKQAQFVGEFCAIKQ